MIRVQNLVKKYGDFTAVNDISFDVAQGEICRLPGPQRRRKNHHHQNADHSANAHQRRSERGRVSEPVPSFTTRSANVSASSSGTPAWTTSSPPTKIWTCIASST